MKRKIVILVLVLAVAATAIVCVSCAKKEEALEKGMVSYTILNNTGKKVTEITLSDTQSDNKVTSKAGEGGLPDGDSIGLEMEAVLEKNAPDVMFGFTVEGGDNVVAHIQHKTATLTLKLEDGSPTFDIQ